MASSRNRIAPRLETLESIVSLTLVPPLLVAANVFLTPAPVATTNPWTPPFDNPPPPLGPAGPGALNLQQQFDLATMLSAPSVALSTGQLD